MTRYDDVHGRSLRLTEERLHHNIQTAHPELADALDYLTPTLQHPDRIVRSRTDDTVELFYRYCETTPVTSKYLCVFAKTAVDDPFIITMVFTSRHHAGRDPMANDVTIWYDREGDYLEVLFEKKEGHFRATDNDAIMEKVDTEGHVIGFSILNVSQTKDQAPLSVTLRDVAA